MNKRIRIACWLFFIGSGLFVGEAIAELSHHFSVAGVIHFAEGALFAIGSLLFMPSLQN